MPRIGGWVPDVPDIRDFSFSARMLPAEEQPGWLASKLPCLFGAKSKYLPKVDLTAGDTAPLWLPVYDQGPLGSCVEHAWAGALGFVRAKEGVPPQDRDLSKSFLYYEVRRGVPEDTGSSIRDGIKTVARVGDCLEGYWPYDVSRWKDKPAAVAYADAAKRKAVTYARLSTLDDMLRCLMGGFPFVYGMSVYDSFESLSRYNAVLPMPKPTETLLGGHALCAVGYDYGKKLFLVRNSWGRNWGALGYFWLPFAYATDRNLSDDFWTCRAVPVA